MPRKASEPGHHGILLVDKPAGWTSHDVVAKVRGLARQRQVGHTGTLDPMATGLLVVCLGRATRLVEYMTGHDKTYEGEIQLGAATTTDDAEGDITEERSVPTLTDELLREMERRFSGALQQVPPAFSAVKVAGRRAYAVARKGGALELAPRTVLVHGIRLAAQSEDRLRIDVTCGPGTYVRGLARDIGRTMGSAGHLAALRRTRAGGFDVGEAWSLEDLATLASGGLVGAAVLPPDEGVSDLPAAIVGEQGAAQLSHGGRPRVDPGGPIPLARVFDSGGEFVAIGCVREDERLRPLKVFTL